MTPSPVADPTVKQQVLTLLAAQPGLTDAQLRELIEGKSGRHQQVNTACRELEQEGHLQRHKPAKGTIQNFLSTQDLPTSLQAGAQAWTPEEMLAAVAAYWNMLQLELGGQAYSKRQLVQKLRATTLGQRSNASIEYRMQNISAVLESVGRTRIQGYKPAQNVGATPRKQILAFLAGLDDTLPDVLRELPLPQQAQPPTGNPTPQRKQTLTTTFQRDPAIVAWVLERSQGICERCGKDAPFALADGRPYLEVHHVVPLAQGGADTTSNAAALCPNCHREAHYGGQAQQVAQELQMFLTILTP